MEYDLWKILVSNVPSKLFIKYALKCIVTRCVLWFVFFCHLFSLEFIRLLRSVAWCLLSILTHISNHFIKYYIRLMFLSCNFNNKVYIFSLCHYMWFLTYFLLFYFWFTFQFMNSFFICVSSPLKSHPLIS